jgi:C-terminal processing protease CtpA/Prc
MVSHMKNRGWVGIQMDTDEKSHLMKITKVVPGSPAEKAGFHEGDLLVSVNGAKFADNTEEKCVTCEKTKDTFTPGSKVSFGRDGRDVPLTSRWLRFHWTSWPR